MRLFPEHQIGVFMSAFIYPGIPQHFNLAMYRDMASRAAAGADLNAYVRMDKTLAAFAGKVLPPPHSRPVTSSLPPRTVPLSVIDGHFTA